MLYVACFMYCSCLCKYLGLLICSAFSNRYKAVICMVKYSAGYCHGFFMSLMDVCFLLFYCQLGRVVRSGSSHQLQRCFCFGLITIVIRSGIRVLLFLGQLSFHSFSVRFPLLVNRLFFSLSKAARRLFA